MLCLQQVKSCLPKFRMPSGFQMQYALTQHELENFDKLMHIMNNPENLENQWTTARR